MLSDLPVFYRLYMTAVAALLGLVMGSALNCLAYRTAQGEKWSSGRSVCPKCGHELAARDLVPVFSWLFLRGKCRYCQSPVSPRYPLTELTLALCYCLTLWRFGLTWDTAEYIVLFSCLFCLSLVDLDIQIIPDVFLLIPICTRLPAVGLLGGMNGLFSALSALWGCLWHGLALGGAVLVLSLIMDKVLKKESMGGGDIKLLFVLGLYFDIPCCLFLLIAACVVGIVLAYITVKAEKETPFPFGPALSIAAFLTAMIGQPVTAWYMGLFM